MDSLVQVVSPHQKQGSYLGCKRAIDVEQLYSTAGLEWSHGLTSVFLLSSIYTQTPAAQMRMSPKREHKHKHSLDPGYR